MGVINDNVSRRRFLSSAFMGFGLFFGFGAFSMRMLEFLMPQREEKKEEEIFIGKEDDLPKDGLEMEVMGKKLFLIKGEKGVVAFSRKCTDLGCLISWNKARREFICPCHNGVFDKDGKNISGPPPRPLDRFGVSKKDGNIYLKMTV